jgi:hypothetical protein
MSMLLSFEAAQIETERRRVRFLVSLVRYALPLAVTPGEVEPGSDGLTTP